MDPRLPSLRVLVAAAVATWATLVVCVQFTPLGERYVWLHPAGHAIVAVLWALVATRVSTEVHGPVRVPLLAAFTWLAAAHAIEVAGATIAGHDVYHWAHAVPVAAGNLGGLAFLLWAWVVHRRDRSRTPVAGANRS